MDFYEKRKLKKILYSKPILAILVIIVIWFSFAVWSMYKKERDTQLKKIEQKEILEELKTREASLSKEIEKLNTKYGIEQEVRSKFEVGKEGEEMIIIVDSLEEKDLNVKNTRKTFWQKVFDWF